MNRREFLKLSSAVMLSENQDINMDDTSLKLDTSIAIPRIFAVLALILASVSSRNPLVQDFYQILEDLVIRPEKKEK